MLLLRLWAAVANQSGLLHLICVLGSVFTSEGTALPRVWGLVQVIIFELRGGYTYGRRAREMNA